MSRLDTMARFADPNFPPIPDLTGQTARIALSDVFICGGICTVYEATVTIVGTGNADVFEVSDVRVDGYSMRDYPHPIGKILFDEIAGKITIEQAEAALLENYDAD